jgi:molybdate transport system substrate-binding protein
MPRRRRLRPVALSLILVLGLTLATACGGDDDGDAAASGTPAAGGDLEGTITVFAAASLTDAFADVAAAFEEANPGVTVEANFGASSALREQILAGAPADVFASANASNMDRVVESGDVDGLDDFGNADLLVGLCAAEVPCGQFGREALARAGVTPAQDTDEPDVRSLLTKVEAGDLDAGLVYHTDVLAAGDAVEGVAIPEDQNVVAEYPIAALSASGEAEIAAAFVEFVLSDEGQDILASFGFRPA